jgi:hypothetical protein
MRVYLVILVVGVNLSMSRTEVDFVVVAFTRERYPVAPSRIDAPDDLLDLEESTNFFAAVSKLTSTAAEPLLSLKKKVELVSFSRFD